MKNTLLEILKNRKNKYQKLEDLIRLSNKSIYQSILLIHSDTNCFSEKVFRIINNMSSSGICKICSSKTKFEDFNKGYREYCSKRCVNNSMDRTDKTKKTKLEKYGNPTYTNREKCKQTTLAKYGVENIGSLKLGKIQLFKKFYNKIISDSERNGNCIPLFTIEEYISNPKSGILKFKFNKCENIFETYVLNGHIPRCYVCNPIPLKSEAENEIIDFIKKNYDGFIKQSDRSVLKNLELDIYLPEKNLAIEYDGIYWHSANAGKDKQYHLEKLKLCESNGINLLNIFENEWNDLILKETWKSMILNKLGKSNRIYARECIVQEVPIKQKTDFLNSNHLQKNDFSSSNIGLLFNGELVSIMTFGRSRYNKKYEYELHRFCNKLNTGVTGGAAKLLHAFEEKYKPKSLISYANRRHSNGNLYKQLGFEFVGESSPNYFYFKNGDVKLHSRINFQKHKLSKILTIFDPTISEWQNMQNNGYNRIYDCCNLVFVKNYPQNA